MKKLHLALSVQSISESVKDYSRRLKVEPVLIVENEYALWRTETLNLSIRYDPNATSVLRHLGWEDERAESFTSDVDCNGIGWEHFSAEHQASEIREIWPGAIMGH
jgi:hypothetical protein